MSMVTINLGFCLCFLSGRVTLAGKNKILTIENFNYCQFYWTSRNSSLFCQMKVKYCEIDFSISGNQRFYLNKDNHIKNNIITKHFKVCADPHTKYTSNLTSISFRSQNFNFNFETNISIAGTSNNISAYYNFNLLETYYSKAYTVSKLDTMLYCNT